MMGTINFIHPAFRPRVVSDKPCTDGYDVANLVALENYMPPKGFLIESFMRPPVNIYLTFPCNINISQIVLNVAVGSQKSSSFEIFTHSAVKGADGYEQRWENEADVTSKDFEKYLFSAVGRLLQENVDCVSDVVCFSNPLFQPRMPFSRLSPMPSKLFNQPTVEVHIARQLVKHLSSVSHLVVRITKTINGGVPGLRWIEVWGQPSVSCPQEDIDRVLSAYNNITSNGSSKRKNSTHDNIGHGQLTEPRSKNACHPVKSAEVPPEFLDALTFEIMAQPMLLPSRQSIDMSTVEKYNNSEAQYGRPSKDPFTGVPYTTYSKPVPNTALKVRIDHFLLTNSSEEITAAHRTVGKSLDLLSEKRSMQSSVQTSILLEDSTRRHVGVRLQPPGELGPSSASPVPSPSRNVGNITLTPTTNFDNSLDLVLAGRRSFKKRQSTSSSSPLASALSVYTPHPKTGLTLDTAIGSGQKRLSEDKNASSSSEKRAKRKSSSSKGQASVIDLTCDSDHEETSSSLTSTACLRPSSVIRKNHASEHASNLDRSLETAIDQTLSNLPSFQTPDVLAADGSRLTSEWKTTKLECIYCTLKREMGMMYKLDCGDFACRDCLSSRRRTGNIFCNKCLRTTKTKDITKLHA